MGAVSHPFCPITQGIRINNTHRRTNSLIAPPLPEPYCVWYFVAPVLRQDIPPTLTLKCIKGTIVNVFSYDAILSRDSNSSPPRRRAGALLVKSLLRVILRY